MADFVLHYPDGDFEFDIKGFDLMSQRLSILAEVLPAAVGDALRAEAEIEMTEAKRRTPVDTGALRASGFVGGPTQVDAETQVVTLAFGGPAGSGNQGETNDVDVGYAVYVHEDLEAFHPTGEAKFLESVLLQSAPYLADRVATRLARVRDNYEALVQAHDQRNIT